MYYPSVPPIERALQNPKTRERFREADVIFGVNRARNRATVIMHGKARLEHVTKTGRPEGLKVLRFSYDDRTSSLEYFVAACNVLRGGCDYRSTREIEEEKRQFEASLGEDGA